MFEFKVTLAVPSACEAKVDRLFEALLAEQLSKRAESDFLISFNESELKIEISDVELMEKLASKILGCGTVKKFFIENQAEPKNKPEKEIEAKIKATENEHVAGSETEAETESENKKEETESDSEDDTDANAEAEAEEEFEPEPESEETLKPPKQKPKFSLEHVKGMFKEAKTVTHFYESLAEYAQIPNEMTKDFVQFMLDARTIQNRLPAFRENPHSNVVSLRDVHRDLSRCTSRTSSEKKEVFSKAIEEALGVPMEWLICDIINLVDRFTSKPVFKFEVKDEKESGFEIEQEEPKVEAEAKPEPKPETEEPKVEAEAEPEPEPEAEEPKVETEAEPEPKSEELANEKIREELSEEYIKKMYEESENIGDFSKKLADYTQIPDNKSRRAFIELIKAVNQTNKMSWFCIENIINKNAKLLNKDTAYNNNTKLLVSQKIKEKFGLTLMKFLKTVKELMGESKVKAKVELESESETEEPKAEAEETTGPRSEAETEKAEDEEASEIGAPEEEPKAETEVESVLEPDPEEPKVETEEKSVPEPDPEEPKVEAEVKSVPEPDPEEPKVEAEVESVPEPEPEEPKVEAGVESVPEPDPEEPKVEAEVESEPEPDPEEPKVEAEVEPEPEPEPEEPKAETEVESEPKSDEVFDEYWSGIFKCMPKINVTDTERIQKVSKKEKQFLEIDKNQPLSARIKETLEIMEEINLINDETFLSLAEEFVRAQRVIIEKSTPLYQKMRLLQWSKSLQKFVQRYYTNDPNFRVRIEDFLAELREIIL